MRLSIRKRALLPVVIAALTFISSCSSAGDGGAAPSDTTSPHTSPAATESSPAPAIGTTAATSAPVTAAPSANLRDLLPAAVRDKGEIRVGTREDSPPNEYRDDKGALVGWEIELMENVAERLGLKMNISISTFDTFIPGLAAKRHDIVFGNMGVTTERKKTIDFVSTLFVKESFAALKSSKLTISKLDDLCGLSVAIIRGSTEVEEAEEQSTKCTAAGKSEVDAKTYQNANEAYLAVRSERADLFWIGSTNAGYLVEQTKDIMEIVGHHGTDIPVAFAFPKGSDLTPAVHAAVNSLIDDGTYLTILEKWGAADGKITESVINPPLTTD